jgi:hypothetical protein
MTTCGQEMCPNWGGDGRVCPCALFDIEPDCTDDLDAIRAIYGGAETASAQPSSVEAQK